MIINGVYYVYVLLYGLYTIYLQSVLNIPSFVLAIILFALAVRFANLHPAMPWVQLLLIASLHALGQSSLCYPLYLLALSHHAYKEEDKIKSWAMTFACMITYVTTVNFITHSASQNTMYGFMSILDFSAVTWLTRTAHLRTGKLDRNRNERHLLTQKDSLTGLYNYEECHRRLEQQIKHHQPLVLFLIDCTDLKAMNTSGGFQAGNFVLKQMADLIQILFKDALFIARYGGDEFAVVMPLHKDFLTTASYQQKLDSELPKLTGIQNTYGIAIFPQDALTKDDLILHAEHNLFMKKRESWLKREEQMQRSEKLRVVGELASGMAHEIRNPLTTVKGFLQLSKASDYNIENWYGLIMDEIDRMSDLTGEFLQFSKPHQTVFQNHSLNECVLKVISLIESEATSSGHEIHFHEAAYGVHMLMDQDKMIQLLLNMMKNACEAMEANGSIHMKLSRDQKNATLIIADNGPGIPSDQLDKIFHPFFTTKETGTGLGLSICYKIVQDHHGTLEVESELGIGTRFILTFPLAAAVPTAHDSVSVS
ncbi:ATP-binding protein [Paenibacillus qinlingensis]|uniref:histidine kinase n=1 Tax=Paenibacillus qinlingensis TaxID=1837343 RepID=A0ABU1NVE7_9BACL|nr:ATP-binding protein [Paenibacillus qinlingensis]MDR6551446.1 diguanylate cyclase (GGDEF)-like protein [Paenibacillus qinlingensis]